MTRKAGPGRPGGTFIRIERIKRPAPKGQSQDKDVEQSALNRSGLQPRIRIYIGKALWRSIGSPMRIQIESKPFRISPAQADTGYAIVVVKGIPRAWIDGARGIIKQLPDGRYIPQQNGNALIIKE